MMHLKIVSWLILSTVHTLATVVLYSALLNRRRATLQCTQPTVTQYTQEKYNNQPTITTQLSQLLNVRQYYLSQPYMAII